MEQGPKTIEELKQWYIDRKLPSENVTRFFIGRDYKGAKAFGIYKDEITGNCIVYKNKADGSRVVRYNGENEAYAVNELYKKLKSEIHNQKNNNPRNYNINNGYNPIKYTNNYNSQRVYSGKSVNLPSVASFIMLFVVILALVCFFFIKSPKRGYYKYNDNYYYCQNGSWYEYNDYGSWKPITVPQTLKDNYSDYYSSYSYMYSYGIDDFEDSIYYEEPTSYSSSSSDYDSDYDWDSGSDWDSDYTDWDSDW